MMTSIRIAVAGLACAAGQEPSLEDALRRVQGVVEANVNLSADALHVDVEPRRFRPADAARVVESFATRQARAPRR